MKVVLQRILLGAVILSATIKVQADVWFVTETGTGTGDQNWGNACSLQTALAGAASGDEIWVAHGTYTPTVEFCVDCPTTNDRHATFRIRTGQRVYGGFRGLDDNDPNWPGESSLSQRNEDLYVTILSADLNGDDDVNEYPNRDENAYHVVTAVNVSQDTKLSGFTIWHGTANDHDTSDVYERDGAGVLVVATEGNMSSLRITRCKFERNYANHFGGGVAVIWPGMPEDPEDIVPARIVNSTFDDNIASTDDPNDPAGFPFGYGGGVAIHTGACEVTNCIFDGNVALVYGAGVFASGPSGHEPQGVFTNNTFANEKALLGYAVAVTAAADPGAPDVYLNNSICWDITEGTAENIYGYVDVSYCDIYDPDPNYAWPISSYPGGNINLDPNFCDPNNGAFGLPYGSRCIDAGLDILVPPDNADVNDNSTIENPIPWDRIRKTRLVDVVP